MIVLNPETTYFNCECRKVIPSTLLRFLRSLSGLTVIDIKGKDNSRTRVVTTLIHGNEPSGLIACHAWLKGTQIPATNIRIIICNPEAAKTKPFFTNRYLKHSDDLNRFFSMGSESQRRVTKRARKIKKLVRQVSPEAIVDLHNTSGSSPAFAVSTCDDLKHLKLIELFTNKLILTQLNVGAIMEQNFKCPIVTIECGGANEELSHHVASDGLNIFFTKNCLFDKKESQVTIRTDPIRVELEDEASVGFSDHLLATTDITLRGDIEAFNKNITKQGELIGWCNDGQRLPIKAIDKHDINKIDEFFKIKDHGIYTRIDMQLFMATTIPEIATKDCLFYTTI